MAKIADIISIIESFAPVQLQEPYDNAGLQVGDPQASVTAVLLCLDVTTDIVAEAIERGCNLIISHHPLLFGGIKSVTTSTECGRIVIDAVRHNIAIYSAHTNLDRAREGVSWEIARMLGLRDIEVLQKDHADPGVGLGIVGQIEQVPTLEFLRKVKDIFHVKCLRYSDNFPSLTVKRVAVCGGAGASLIREAVRAGADVMVTGDVKYHDFTTYSPMILIADIGHFESELCTRLIFMRLLSDRFSDLQLYVSEVEGNPVNCL